MNISVSQEKGRVPVAVIHLEGKLDGQTYQELINEARAVFESGTRDILLDMEKLSYISSAGLVALHTVALLTRGESLPDPEQGWATLKSMDRSRDGGLQRHLKLLNPPSDVVSVLDMVGFTGFFEVFTDKQKAIQAF